MFCGLKKHKSGAQRIRASGPGAGFRHRNRISLTTVETRSRLIGLSNRSLLLLMLLLTWAAKSTAQSFPKPEFEYPALPCELRNEHRVFVQAPLSTRQEIVKELSRHEEIVIAERPEDADYFLFFAYTPVADGLGTGFMGETAGSAGFAEMTAVKYVNSGKEQLRPRILFYWQGKKTSHSVPLPFHGLSPNGFSRPRSTKSAVEELIGRFFGWAITKKWPDTFYFDQFSNLLTISTGGKFEARGAKAFRKELEKARGESYAKCATPLSPAYRLPEWPSSRLKVPSALAAELSFPVPVERPRVGSPSQSRRRGRSARRRSLKR